MAPRPIPVGEHRGCEDDAGELAFHPLLFLTNDDVADVLQIARARIVALLRRKGVVADDDGSGARIVTADAALADNEPALAGLAVASTLGTVPAGPALRRRDPLTLRGGRELQYTKGLCAADRGFSLHAATTASAGDAAGREALCKYILRPPIAAERIQLVADDLVRLILALTRARQREAVRVGAQSRAARPSSAQAAPRAAWIARRPGRRLPLDFARMHCEVGRMGVHVGYARAHHFWAIALACQKERGPAPKTGTEIGVRVVG